MAKAPCVQSRAATPLVRISTAMHSAIQEAALVGCEPAFQQGGSFWRRKNLFRIRSLLTARSRPRILALHRRLVSVVLSTPPTVERADWPRPRQSPAVSLVTLADPKTNPRGDPEVEGLGDIKQRCSRALESDYTTPLYFDHWPQPLTNSAGESSFENGA